MTIYERSSVAKGPCQIPAFIAVEPGVQPGGVCIQLDALDRSRLYFHLGPVDRRRSRVLKHRSEEHTSELQSLMRISYAVFCLKKKKFNLAMKYPREQQP